MPEPQVAPDWAAEAAKFGGKVVEAPSGSPDWAAEAAKYGGKVVEAEKPKPDPRAQSQIVARTPSLWETISGPIREGLGIDPFHTSTRTKAARDADGETPSNTPIIRFTAAAPNDDGAIHTAAKFLEDLTTPSGLAMLAGTSGLGAIESAFGKSTLGKLVQYGFSADMLSNAIQKSPAVMDAIKAGDWNKARGLATDVLINAGFGAHMAGAGRLFDGKAPRTTPAPPVEGLTGGRSTLPMPDKIPAAIGKSVGEAANAISQSDTLVGKGSRLVGTGVRAAKELPGDLYEINPGRGLVHAYGKGIDRRLVNDIEETRADIVGYGGPAESNADILKYGPKATEKFKNEYEPFLKRAEENERTLELSGQLYGFDVGPIIEATYEAIPYGKHQLSPDSSGGQQVKRIMDDVKASYSGRRMTARQLDALRESLVDDVNKLYKMNPADRAAAEGSGAPLAVVEAQRRAVNKILYEGIDPETGGARPRELNRRRGRIIGLMKEAESALNDIDAQKHLSTLETIGGATAGVVESTVGAPFHGDLAKSVGKVTHPASGKSDPIIKRIFKGAKQAKPIPGLKVIDPEARFTPPPLPRYAATPTPPRPTPPPSDTPPPFKSAEESAQILANAPEYRPTAAESAEVLVGPAAVAAQQAREFAAASGVRPSAAATSTTPRPPLTTSVPVESGIARAERLAKERAASAEAFANDQAQQSLAEKALDQLQREKAKQIGKPVIPETGISGTVARRQAARDEAVKQMDVNGEGWTWETLKQADRNIIEDWIDNGMIGSVKPAAVRVTTRPPVLNIKKRPKP